MHRRPIRRSTPLLSPARTRASRRAEKNLFSFFYMFGQSAATANDDGTIQVGGLTGLNDEPKKFREVEPWLWREVGGEMRLAATHDEQGNVVSLVPDGYGPIIVFQRAAGVARQAMVAAGDHGRRCSRGAGAAHPRDRSPAPPLRPLRCRQSGAGRGPQSAALAGRDPAVLRVHRARGVGAADVLQRVLLGHLVRRAGGSCACCSFQRWPPSSARSWRSSPPSIPGVRRPASCRCRSAGRCWRLPAWSGRTWPWPSTSLPSAAVLAVGRA